MLLYNGYPIVLSYLILRCSPYAFPLPPSLFLSLSMFRATNPQLSSQRSSCQCEIETWGTFPRPGLSTHPISRLQHRCIRWLVVETKCFGRSCWELPLKIYPAKTLNAPLPAYTHALHHCHQLTHAHSDILTDCLIANEAEGRD